MKEQKVIVATQGEERNVIAMTPPLCFTLENARRVIRAFDNAFTKASKNEEVAPVPPNTSILGYANKAQWRYMN